ncbi:MAG: CoA pyrophosphatase [Pseudomonadales bacterium]|nr:CoA pyrophosphatase [Pseudomonadales bacterium]
MDCISTQQIISGDCVHARRLLHYFHSRDPQRQGQVIPHPDPRFNPDSGTGKNSACNATYQKAAVLIPVQRATGHLPSQILFTVRTDTLARHAGQVSFPGGRCDPEDSSAIATALRESTEEIGLPAGSVQVLGQLGDIFLPSGYQVTPVVGFFDPEVELVPSPHEVADIFLAPAELVLNPGNFQRSLYRHAESEHQVLELYFNQHRIWGATATILHHLGKELGNL